MKMKVMIDSQTYLVDVEDIHARPVIAIVDGERYEVWPEGEASQANAPAATPAISAPTADGAGGTRRSAVCGQRERTYPHRCRVSSWQSWSSRVIKSPAGQELWHAGSDENEERDPQQPGGNDCLRGGCGRGPGLTWPGPDDF